MWGTAYRCLSILRFIPAKYKTQKFCLGVIACFGGIALEYIHTSAKYITVCTAAIKDDIKSLHFVPEKLLYLGFSTQEMCRRAFEENVYFIRYIPPEWITQEMCDQAFNKSIDCFKFIPDEFKTKVMCDEYMASEHRSWDLEFIPREFITQEVCDKYVANYSRLWNLKSIPDEFKTKKLCNHVAKYRLWDFKFIPEKWLTQKMCNRAFEENTNMGFKIHTG